MVTVHSIMIIKKGNKFFNYFDERWQTYFFPNIKGNDIEEIKKIYGTSKVKYIFDKVHDKYSVSHGIMRTYHHYFFEVDIEMDGEYFTLDELLEIPEVRENNEDVINFLKEYYNIK